MCSVFKPGCSSTTCLSISITSLTPSSLWGFRVPTQWAASLRLHRGRCFNTNYNREGSWMNTDTEHHLRNWAFVAITKTGEQDVCLTSMWPNVCTSGMTSMPLDLANSCIDNTSSRLETQQTELNELTEPKQFMARWTCTLTFISTPHRKDYHFITGSYNTMRQIKNSTYNSTQPINQEWNDRQCPVFTSQTAPVSRLHCGLQQLHLPPIRKHVLILHQQAIGSQLREQLDQLRTWNTH